MTLTIIKMSLELVELALSQTNVKIDHRVVRCSADIGPLAWDIVRILDLVSRASAHRRCKCKICGEQKCQRS